MEITELGIVSEVKPQPQNAANPMEVTELGIVIEVRSQHPTNATLWMEVTELGISVFRHPAIRVLEAVSIMALQLLRLSYTVFPLSTVIEVKLSQ